MIARRPRCDACGLPAVVETPNGLLFCGPCGSSLTRFELVSPPSPSGDADAPGAEDRAAPGPTTSGANLSLDEAIETARIKNAIQQSGLIGK